MTVWYDTRVSHFMHSFSASGACDEHPGGNQMAKYVCNVCGYEYDPEVGDPDNGIAPGTAWEDVPDDWVCPLCGVGKDDFSEA